MGPILESQIGVDLIVEEVCARDWLTLSALGSDVRRRSQDDEMLSEDERLQGVRKASIYSNHTLPRVQTRQPNSL